MGITKIRGHLQVRQNTVPSDLITNQTITAEDIAVGSLNGALFINGSIPAEKIDVESLAGDGLTYNSGTNELDVTSGAGATTDASLLTSGTLADARLSVNVTLVGNIFNAPDKLVKLLSDGKLPILDGSNLTGIAGGVVFVDEVVPSGAINGSNMVFVLPSIPASGTLHLYINGILQRAGAGNDYTISSATVTMTWAPRAGSVILASYRL